MKLKTRYGEVDMVVAEGVGALLGHFMLGGAYFHLSSCFQVAAPEKYLVTAYEGASIEQRRSRLGRGEGATPEAAVEACVDDHLGTMRKLRDSCNERIARFPEVGAPPRHRRYLVQVCLEREDLYRTLGEDDLVALRAIDGLEERQRALVRLSEPARVGSSREVELEIVPHDPDKARPGNRHQGRQARGPRPGHEQVRPDERGRQRGAPRGLVPAEARGVGL